MFVPRVLKEPRTVLYKHGQSYVMYNFVELQQLEAVKYLFIYILVWINTFATVLSHQFCPSCRKF